MYKEGEWGIYLKHHEEKNRAWIVQGLRGMLSIRGDPDYYTEGINMRKKSVTSIHQISQFQKNIIYNVIRKQWKPVKKGWIFGN